MNLTTGLFHQQLTVVSMRTEGKETAVGHVTKSTMPAKRKGDVEVRGGGVSLRRFAWGTGFLLLTSRTVSERTRPHFPSQQFS